MRLIKKQRTLYISCAVACSVVISVGVALFWHFSSENISEQSHIATQPQASHREAEKKEEPATQDKAEQKTQPQAVVEPVMITLPGATPIVARQSTYTNDTDIWKIVNKSHAFNNPRYVAPDLQIVSVRTKAGRGNDERSARKILMVDLQAKVAAAQKDGVTLIVGSGYRSYGTQAVLFNSYVRQHGEAEAARFSSRPGHSEHQSGLAIDFDTPDGRCWVDDCFGATTEGKWLANNAHKYGFTLRYPAGKESVTGYMYESWHFRYVGKELATALYQSGLTLEEAAPYLAEAQTKLERRDQHAR